MRKYFAGVYAYVSTIWPWLTAGAVLALAVLAMINPGLVAGDNPDFGWLPVTSYAGRIAAGLAGLLAMVWFLRWLDRRAGLNFTSVLATLSSNPTALAIYLGARLLAVALLLGILAGCSAAHAGALSEAKYDRAISRAVATWWPDYPDWLSWKAQLYQESRFNPNAVSPVGARGLAQFMPGTWRDVTRALNWASVDPTMAGPAIEAGAYYMATLRRAWSSPRPQDERHRLAQASYNAGLGNILAAQRACGGARDWADISRCLPSVTGRHAQETLTYVERIARWRAQLELLG